MSVSTLGPGLATVGLCRMTSSALRGLVGCAMLLPDAGGNKAKALPGTMSEAVAYLLELGSFANGKGGDDAQLTSDISVKSWAVAALAELATIPAARGAILKAGGLSFACELSEIAAIGNDPASKPSGDESQVQATTPAPRPPSGGSSRRPRRTQRSSVGEVDAGLTGFGKIAAGGGSKDSVTKRPPSGRRPEQSTDVESSSAKPSASEIASRDDRKSFKPSHPLLPKSALASLRSLVRSLTYADLDKFRGVACVLDAPTLLMLCANAIGDDAAAEQQSAHATASSAQDDSPIIASPYSLVHLSRLALATLLSIQENRNVLSAASTAAAARCGPKDLELIRDVIACLSKILSDKGQAGRSESVTANVVASLSTAVRSHCEAYTTLGHADHAPPLDVLPVLSALLHGENTALVIGVAELISLICLTRSGRAALVALGQETGSGALQSLGELLSHPDSSVRRAVLASLHHLSEDSVAYHEVLRTSAVQGLLDLIGSDRLDNPTAPTSPLWSGTQLQQAMTVLCSLARRDMSLRDMCRDHPAVADLHLEVL